MGKQNGKQSGSQSAPWMAGGQRMLPGTRPQGPAMHAWGMGSPQISGDPMAQALGSQIGSVTHPGGPPNRSMDPLAAQMAAQIRSVTHPGGYPMHQEPMLGAQMLRPQQQFNPIQMMNGSWDPRFRRGY